MRRKLALAVFLAVLAGCLNSDPAAAWCETVNCQIRRTTGVGQYGLFHRGESVVAFRIWIDGRFYENCYIPWAWANGTALDGAINPWHGELRQRC